MNRNRRVKLGVGLLAGGLAVLTVDTFLATSVYAVVGLVILLVIPPVVAFAGAIVLLTGLARKAEGESRSQTFGRFVGLATVGGVAIGLTVTLWGIVALVPGWAKGYTGMFGAGFGAGIGAFLEVGVGLLMGAVVGVAVASIWWLVRGHLLPASPAYEVAPGTYSVPPGK